VEVHGQLTLRANVRFLETKYKRSKIAFGVTRIAFTDVKICTELLQIPTQALIGSPGTLKAARFVNVRGAPRTVLEKVSCSRVGT